MVKNIRILSILTISLALYATTAIGMMSRAATRGATALKASWPGASKPAAYRLVNQNVPTTPSAGRTYWSWSKSNPPRAYNNVVNADRAQIFKSAPSSDTVSVTNLNEQVGMSTTEAAKVLGVSVDSSPEQAVNAYLALIRGRYQSDARLAILNKALGVRIAKAPINKHPVNLETDIPSQTNAVNANKTDTNNSNKNNSQRKNYNNGSKMLYATATGLATGLWAGADFAAKNYFDHDPLVQDILSQSNQFKEQYNKLRNNNAPTSILQAYNLLSDKIESQLISLLQEYSKAKQAQDAEQIEFVKKSLDDVSGLMLIAVTQAQNYINNTSTLNPLIKKYTAMHTRHTEMFPRRANEEKSMVNFDSIEPFDSQIKNSTNRLFNNIYYETKSTRGIQEALKLYLRELKEKVW